MRLQKINQKIKKCVTADEKSVRVSAKIHNAQLQKNSSVLVFDAREAPQRPVAVCARAGGDEGAVDVDVFVKCILSEIQSRQSTC